MKGGYQIIDCKSVLLEENAATGLTTGVVIEGIAEAILNRNGKPLLLENLKLKYTPQGALTTTIMDINGIFIQGCETVIEGAKAFVFGLNDLGLIQGMIMLSTDGKDTIVIRTAQTI